MSYYIILEQGDQWDGHDYHELGNIEELEARRQLQKARDEYRSSYGQSGGFALLQTVVDFEEEAMPTR